MILDTNALSAWCDDDREFLAVLPSDRPLYLAVIVLGEYRFGIKVTRDRAAREEWLERMETALPVLDAHSITARHYGDVREELRKARTPIPENDVWIAARAPASTPSSQPQRTLRQGLRLGASKLVSQANSTKARSSSPPRS